MKLRTSKRRLAESPGDERGFWLTSIGRKIDHRVSVGFNRGPSTLRSSDQIGKRETQAGSGYRSQNGAVQVMETPEPPTQIWVRWPGGETVTANIPPSALEIELNAVGKLKVVR